MPSIRFSRDVNVRHEVDVFVAGGGPAGVAAAVAAARQGCSVFLVESQGCLGGSGTAGGLPVFCHFTDLESFVAGGVGRDVYDRLYRCGGQGPGMRYDDPHGVVVYKAEVLKRVYDDLLAESGAEWTFFTDLVAVEAAKGRVDCVVCAAKSGLFAVRAKVYVDCTGDGDLAAWAGAPFEKGDAAGALQPPTLCSLWADIDWQRADREGCGIWQQEKHLPAAIANGVFSVGDVHMPGMAPVGEHLGGGNIGHIHGTDATDERCVTRAMIRGRKLLLEYETYFKKYLKGYERMELAATAAMLGIRETRRILGDYVLNVQDFLRRAVFEDEIGRFAYPIDVHAPTPDRAGEVFEGMRRYRMGPGESYGIPYRVLTPRGLSNVLTAGRCVSADRQVFGSIRVMPGCFITGQAAGVAAAIAARGPADVRQVPIAELHGRLKALGAFLPNARPGHE